MRLVTTIVEHNEKIKELYGLIEKQKYNYKTLIRHGWSWNGIIDNLLQDLRLRIQDTCEECKHYDIVRNGGAGKIVCKAEVKPYPVANGAISPLIGCEKFDPK